MIENHRFEPENAPVSFRAKMDAFALGFMIVVGAAVRPLQAAGIVRC